MGCEEYVNLAIRHGFLFLFFVGLDMQDLFGFSRFVTQLWRGIEVGW